MRQLNRGRGFAPEYDAFCDAICARKGIGLLKYIPDEPNRKIAQHDGGNRNTFRAVHCHREIRIREKFCAAKSCNSTTANDYARTTYQWASPSAFLIPADVPDNSGLQKSTSVRVRLLSKY